MTDFSMLGLHPKIQKSLDKLSFKTATPIQAQAIPHILAGQDIMGLAQTGTGKTAAFGLPMIEQLVQNRGKPAPKTARALVLAPTRELAMQIADNLVAFANGFPLRLTTVVGGMPIRRQTQLLARGTDILIATPGRLMDLVERKALQLKETRMLVLDEADQMLDLGFIHTLKKISQLVGSDRQTVMFSATMPRKINDLAAAFLRDPIRIEVAKVGLAADKITQSVHHVGAQKDKAGLLKECLRTTENQKRLVFVRTKHGAERLMKQLVAAGFKAGSVHGNKNQNQRQRALNAFRTGKTDILVATDVAARGIDIPDITVVYNFDLPEVAESYIHRIGRTARAGKEGQAVSFCQPDEYGLLLAAEKIMKRSVDIASGTAPDRVTAPQKPAGGRGRGRRRGKAGSGGGRPRSARGHTGGSRAA